MITKPLTGFFCFTFFSLFGINNTDTIYVICKDSSFNDSTFIANKYHYVYKSKRKCFYMSVKKSVSKKASETFMDIKDKYVIFVLGRKNGVRIEEGHWYDEAWHDGYYKYYYKNGIKKSEGVFVINKKVGKWFYYNEKGVLMRTENYDDDSKVLGTMLRYPLLK